MLMSSQKINHQLAPRRLRMREGADSPLAHLEDLYLTTNVHSDCLGAIVSAMQSALDQAQQEEHYISRLEEEANAAHESLDRITRMADALLVGGKGSISREELMSGGTRSHPLATSDPLRFAKQASTFGVVPGASTYDSHGSPPNSQKSGGEGKEEEERTSLFTTPDRHRQALASVSGAEAKLAAIRHQLALTEHNSVRRRLIRLEGIKQRINKALDEFVDLVPLIVSGEALRDVRRRSRAIVERVYPSSTCGAATEWLSQSDESEKKLTKHYFGVNSEDTDRKEDEKNSLSRVSTRVSAHAGGGDRLDALMRDALCVSWEAICEAVQTVEGLLDVAEGRERSDGLCDESPQGLASNPVLERVFGQSNVALTLAALCPRSSIDGRDEDGEEEEEEDRCLSAAFAAVIASRRLSAELDMEWLCALGRNVGLDAAAAEQHRQHTYNNTIADHYATLLNCWQAGGKSTDRAEPKSEASEPERDTQCRSKKYSHTNASSFGGLSSHMSIPLPPRCQLEKLFDPSCRPLVSTLPPAKHILHRRFTHRGPHELKALEAARTNAIRIYTDTLAEEAKNSLLSEGGGGAAIGEGPERQRGAAANTIDSMRFNTSGLFGYRTWPAASRAMPANDE